MKGILQHLSPLPACCHRSFISRAIFIIQLGFLIKILASMVRTVFLTYTNTMGMSQVPVRYRGGFKDSLSHGDGDAFNDAGDRYFGG